MSPSLPIVSGRDVVRALTKAGVTEVSQRGSHVKLRNEAGRTAIVPHQGSWREAHSARSSDKQTSTVEAFTTCSDLARRMAPNRRTVYEVA